MRNTILSRMSRPLGALALACAALAPWSAAQAITFGVGGEFAWSSPFLVSNGSGPASSGPGPHMPAVVSTADGNVLRLVEDNLNAPGQAGSVFVNNPYIIGSNSDFRASFSFRIWSPDPNSSVASRSDGLAFVIGGSPHALGNAGFGLGYDQAPGLAHSLIVEFDVHDNVFDADDSHIGVMLNGDSTTHQFSHKTALPIDNGDLMQAVISYYGQGDLLTVTLRDVEQNQSLASIQYKIDLAAQLNCNPFGCPFSYFGFTAATGLGVANHDLVDFALSIPEPGTLPLLLGGGAAALMVLRRRAAESLAPLPA